MNILGVSNLTICTACRDSEAGVDAFRRRVEALAWLAESLRVVVCEGDSVDGTADKLLEWMEQDARARLDARIKLVKHNTGEPKYGSVVHPARFRNLARVFNEALDAVDLGWTDHVLFLPFDVEIEPDLVRRLLAHDVDLVSPMTWRNGMFYDTWACTPAEGEQWVNFPKAWAERHWHGKLIPMHTIGGTILIKVDVLKDGVRYTEEEVDRGFSKWARRLGYSCWLDTGTHVQHP